MMIYGNYLWGCEIDNKFLEFIDFALNDNYWIMNIIHGMTTDSIQLK